MKRAIAWHGEKSLHESAKARMREHVDLDKVAQNHGWWDHDNGKGCWVGCLIANESRKDINVVGFRVRRAELRNQFGLSDELSNAIENAFETCEEQIAPMVAEYCTAVVPVGFDSSDFPLILGNFCTIAFDSRPFWEFLAQLQRLCAEQDIPLELDPVKLLPHRFPEQQPSTLHQITIENCTIASCNQPSFYI